MKDKIVDLLMKHTCFFYPKQDFSKLFSPEIFYFMLLTNSFLLLCKIYFLPRYFFSLSFENKIKIRLKQI